MVINMEEATLKDIRMWLDMNEGIKDSKKNLGSIFTYKQFLLYKTEKRK